jgi:hypothetical protein
VSIVSMANSTPEDIPRRIEFLYSLNRLNVAVSRVQAPSVLSLYRSFSPLAVGRCLRCGSSMRYAGSSRQRTHTGMCL